MRDIYDRVIAEVERPLIQMTLSATRGNQIKAAAMLGLNRNTLRKKIRDLEIPVVRGHRLAHASRTMRGAADSRRPTSVLTRPRCCHSRRRRRGGTGWLADLLLGKVVDARRWPSLALARWRWLTFVAAGGRRADHAAAELHLCRHPAGQRGRCCWC